MSQLLASDPSAAERPVCLELADVVLNGDLSLPPNPQGLVLFAHGQQEQPAQLEELCRCAGAPSGTLWNAPSRFLTEDEGRTDQITAEFRFDIPMLGDRVVAAVDWAGSYEATSPLALGVFGASTGAAAALIAAAKRPRAVRAVVSRGGRPDLAGEALRAVIAPTLLVVGGRDEVIELNRQAFDQLSAPKELEIVPGASHLFEEPGTVPLLRNWPVTGLRRICDRRAGTHRGRPGLKTRPYSIGRV